MEDYRKMLIDEFTTRGVAVDNERTQRVITSMVRELENEQTEFGEVGVSAFVLGVLFAKGFKN